MPKYIVQITTQNVYEVPVTAKNMEEAIDIADENFGEEHRVDGEMFTDVWLADQK